MPTLTSPQEARFDDAQFPINALVYPYTPSLVFEAPLTGSVSRKGAYIALTYGTPTVGSIAAVKPEMTVQIDIDGDADGGRQRVRGAGHTSDTLYIGRCSAGTNEGQMIVDQGGTIRVYDEKRPFIKATFIEVDEEDLTVTQYKDELEYPGGNASQPPVANIDPDMLIITEAETFDIDLNALGVNPSMPIAKDSNITDYLWDLDDGTTGDALTAGAITATFPRGARYVSLTVTDNFGSDHTTHCLIVVAREEDCLPAFIEGNSVTPKGNSMILRVNTDELENASIRRGAKVLVAELEGYSNDTIIGYSERFSGWLGSESNTLEDAASGNRVTQISLYDVSAFLSRNALPEQSINIAQDTGGWFQMPNANIDRMIHHMLHWHSNVLDMTCYNTSAQGGTYPFPSLTTGGNTFFDDINRLAQAFSHELTVSTRGLINIVRDPHRTASTEQASEYSLPVSRFTGVVTTFTEDRYTEYTLDTESTPQYKWLFARAIVASETVEQTVRCVAPGNAPGLGDSTGNENNLLVTTQDELNVWMANLYAADYGMRIGRLRFKALNPAHILEPAYREYIGVTLPAIIRQRFNLSESDNRWTVEQIDYSYSPGGEKSAIYTCKKEIVANQPARTITEEGGDTVQDWDGFDSDFSPGTGVPRQIVSAHEYDLDFEDCVIVLLEDGTEKTLIDISSCVGDTSEIESRIDDLEDIVDDIPDVPPSNNYPPPATVGTGQINYCNAVEYIADTLYAMIESARISTDTLGFQWEAYMNQGGWDADLLWTTLDFVVNDADSIPDFLTDAAAALPDVKQALYCAQYSPSGFEYEMSETEVATAISNAYTNFYRAAWSENVYKWAYIGGKNTSANCDDYDCAPPLEPCWDYRIDEYDSYASGAVQPTWVPGVGWRQENTTGAFAINNMEQPTAGGSTHIHMQSLTTVIVTNFPIQLRVIRARNGFSALRLIDDLPLAAGTHEVTWTGDDWAREISFIISNGAFESGQTVSIQSLCIEVFEEE